jgi:hypothetical protein
VNDATRTELRALLTRAAVLEARRQAALGRGDTCAEQAAERELAEIWRRHSELEGLAACG